jgi:hypothetical protein
MQPWQWVEGYYRRKRQIKKIGMYQSIFKLPRKACHIHQGRCLHTLTHLPAQVSQAGMIDSQFSGNVHKVIPVLSSQLRQADLV